MSNWENNQLQYARLIAELQQAGAFNAQIMDTLCLEMDLEPRFICEIIDRACSEWDEQKKHF